MGFLVLEETSLRNTRWSTMDEPLRIKCYLEAKEIIFNFHVTVVNCFMR